MYTNVPVDEAITLAADRLYDGTLKTPPVDKATFKELLELAVTNVVLLTHDGYYRQGDGLAMGAPPAPHLANIWLSKYDPVIKGDSGFYERYMDDILQSIMENCIEQKLEQINQLHVKLTFTMERETASKIPFLDMLIEQVGRKLSSGWYCKPSDTGLILNFHAQAPIIYKRNIVQGFVHRIHRASSTEEKFQVGLMEAKKILQDNQYPSSFFEPIIKETISKIMDTDERTPRNIENAPIRKALLCLQYRGQPTNRFIKKLRDCGAPIKTVLTMRKLKTVLPSLKPKLQKPIKSSVVYQILLVAQPAVSDKRPDI